MPYVYKYVNRQTKDVEYVGIVKKESNFPNRFLQHKNDSWYEFGKYDIYFAEVESGTDAEALEGHFIKLYGSDRFHNIKKTKDWGICSFAPEVKWVLYDPSMYYTQEQIGAFSNTARSQLKSLMCRVSDFENEINKLWDAIYHAEEEEEKMKRKSVRAWFRGNLEFADMNTDGKRADKETLFSMYCDFAEDSEELWAFTDSDDFWDTFADMPDYRRSIQGEWIFGIVTKEEYWKTVNNDVSEKLEMYYAKKSA